MSVLNHHKGIKLYTFYNGDSYHHLPSDNGYVGQRLRADKRGSSEYPDGEGLIRNITQRFDNETEPFNLTKEYIFTPKTATNTSAHYIVHIIKSFTIIIFSIFADLRWSYEIQTVNLRINIKNN